MLNDLWKYASRIAITVGALLTLLVVAELADLFISIHQVNPPLAWIFAVTFIAVALGGLGSLAWSIYSHPPVLTPPMMADETTGTQDFRAHAAYLARYLRNLSRNPSLDDEDRAKAAAEARQLRTVIGPAATPPPGLLTKTEEETIKPLLSTLREKAHEEVSRCVRDVMFAVTLSPYRSSDILIVLYRNGAMIMRITALYAGRPRLREQLLVFSDTVRVVAAVNLINLSGRLLEGLTARIPFIGTYADDIAQGVGAGFLTSAAGHALVDRCEAFHGWEREEAVASLGQQSTAFMSDVKDVFFREVVPGLRPRMRSTLAETEDAGFWLKISDGIRASIDATGAQLQGYVIRPARIGGRAVANSGSKIGGAIAIISSAAVNRTRSVSTAAAGRASRAGSTAGRGLVRGARSALNWTRGLVNRPRKERTDSLPKSKRPSFGLSQVRFRRNSERKRP